jgi:hypothetical protein
MVPAFKFMNGLVGYFLYIPRFSAYLCIVLNDEKQVIANT